MDLMERSKLSKSKLESKFLDFESCDTRFLIPILRFYNSIEGSSSRKIFRITFLE